MRRDYIVRRLDDSFSEESFERFCLRLKILVKQQALDSAIKCLKDYMENSFEFETIDFNTSVKHLELSLEAETLLVNEGYLTVGSIISLTVTDLSYICKRDKALISEIQGTIKVCKNRLKTVYESMRTKKSREKSKKENELEKFLENIKRS